MASIVKRSARDGTSSYFVKYKAGDGKVHWERFPKAKDAQRRKAEIELELGRSGGQWRPPVDRTFADVWLRQREQAVKDHTLRNYRSSLSKHLLPEFGTRHVAAIRRSDVEAFAAALASKGMAAGSIAQVVGLMRQILATLVKDEQLARNVATGVGRFGRRPRKATPPSSEQVDRLLAASRDDARPILGLAVSTGLRRGELFKLHWRDVDLDARELTVRASKTQAGERVVPMFGSARKVLLETKARSRFSRPDDLVFPTAVGTPESAEAWVLREFYPAMKRAGLEGAFRFHDLRHYSVSCLIEQGANILLVSRVAGHARASITLDVYAHLFKEGLAEAARRFDPLRRESGDFLPLSKGKQLELVDGW